MIYKPPYEEKPYLLNLLDTPGHVDFSSEVLRSLLAVQGSLLLVDCTQGIQAQTLVSSKFDITGCNVSLTLNTTQSVLDAARKRNLQIVGVINKVFPFDLHDIPTSIEQCTYFTLVQIDLPNSDVAGTTSEVTALLGPDDPILPISAKTGQGVEAILDAIVKYVPPPPLPNIQDTEITTPFQALAFDSWYDEFKGVVSLIAIASGSIAKGALFPQTCSY